MAENDVTLGEVYRAIVEVRQEQRDMRNDLIGRAEYESDQEGIAHKFQESGKVHVQLDARVAEVNAARKVAITEEAAEREKGDARLEARLDRIGGLVKWGGGISVTVLLTVIGWIVASASGGGS